MFDLFFLTSNRVKFDHIKFLLSKYNINLLPTSDYGRPYIEPRIKNRDILLKESIDSANIRLAKSHHSDIESSIFLNEEKIDVNELAKVYQNRFFIIEDTSIAIEALSQIEEFPGVDVKYWMRTIDFKSLDECLRDRNNNRHVKVRSDIALYIPAKFREKFDDYYKVFTGITEGNVVEREDHFRTNAFYPWLDNKTFNKWFSPENENKSISLLPIKEALQYDFRKKAIESLVSFLNSLGVLENRTQSLRYPSQSPLFGTSNFIICGPTCAGKSVLATYLSRNFGMYHIEASDFMYLSYYQKYGFLSDVDIHEFAKQALIDNPLIVSDQVLSHIVENQISQFVITGFRSPKELEPLLSSNIPIVSIYIDADFELRFHRNILRARIDASKSIDLFKIRDEKQKKMGLKGIEKISNIKIENNKGIKSYFYFVKENYLRGVTVRKFKVNLPLKINELYLSLDQSVMLALLVNLKEGNTFLSTNDISNLINKNLSNFRNKRNGKMIVTNKNNVSRYFNQKLQPYFEVEATASVNKFRLSTTGISRAMRIYASVIKR